MTGAPNQQRKSLAATRSFCESEMSHLDGTVAPRKSTYSRPSRCRANNPGNSQTQEAHPFPGGGQWNASFSAMSG